MKNISRGIKSPHYCLVPGYREDVRSAIASIEPIAGIDRTALAQATASSKPSIDGNERLVPTIDFDGGDYLDANWADLTQPFTVIVWWESDITTTHMIWNAAALSCYLGVNGGNLLLFAGSSNQTIASADTNKHVCVAEVNGASTRVWLDNVEVSLAGDPGASGLATIRLGADHATNNKLNGRVAYLCAIDRKILDVEREKNWWAAKRLFM